MSSLEPPARQPAVAPEAGHRWRQSLRDRLEQDNVRLLAVGYLGLLTAAEMLTVLVFAQVGLLLHFAALTLLLFHTALTWGRPIHRFLMSLAFVPLIRIVSLTLPLVGFPLFTWYLITSVPLFVAAAVVMRQLGLSWRDAGLHGRGWAWQVPIAASGLLLGYAEYVILRPEPLVERFSLGQIWLPALVLLVSTGYLEELIFRRIMQRAAVERLGRGWGIAYVALFFAVLHIGYRSVADFVFVLGVGLAFGWLVHWTGNLVGVTLAHGLTNISLFLVLPFLFPLPGVEAPAPPVVAVHATADLSPGLSLLPAPRPDLTEAIAPGQQKTPGLSSRRLRLGGSGPARATEGARPPVDGSSATPRPP